MTAMQHEDLTILEIVGEHEIACDFFGDPFCKGSAAKWVMFKCCPSCSDRKALLACDTCKDARMTSEAGVICQNFQGDGCGELIAPARHAYERVEAL